MKLNYLKMLEDIDELCDNDFCFNMVNKPYMSLDKKYTQEEAVEMSILLGNIYRISHSIHCAACQTKYIKEKK